MFIAIDGFVLLVELEDFIMVDAGGDTALEILEVVKFLRLEIEGLWNQRGAEYFFEHTVH